MSQSYTTKSALFLQFGTDKAFPELAGEYVIFGANRVIEGVLDLTGSAYPAGMSTSSTVPTVISNTNFFPALPTGQLIIEKMEVFCEVATASGTSWNMGLIQASDRVTIPSGYNQALISAEVAATNGTAGALTTYVQSTTHAGSLIGSQAASATGPYILTAYTTGTFTTGQLRYRIFYHARQPMTAISNITQ